MRTMKLFWSTLPPHIMPLFFMAALPLVPLLMLTFSGMTTNAMNIIALIALILGFVIAYIGAYKVRHLSHNRDVRKWFGYEYQDSFKHPTRDIYLEEYVDEFLMELRKYFLRQFRLKSAFIWNIDEGRRLVRRHSNDIMYEQMNILIDEMSSVTHDIVQRTDFPIQAALKLQLMKSTAMLKRINDLPLVDDSLYLRLTINEIRDIDELL